MRRKMTLIFTFSICLLTLSVVSVGQSGRKQKKTDPQPPVQGTNRPDTRVTPEPQIAPEKTKEKEPRRSMMVMSGMPDMMMPIYFADIARQGCVREFREELKTIDLREASNQTRSDAIKTAKDDDRTYVVLIDLEYDRTGSSRSGVDLRYTIFEPKTAKVAGSGWGRPVQPTGRLPLPPVGASNEQVYIEWAGRDVARQVMKKLGLVP